MTTAVVVAAPVPAPQTVAEAVNMFGNRGGDDWMANEVVKLGVVVDAALDRQYAPDVAVGQVPCAWT
jgi:hypothetical protein